MPLVSIIMTTYNRSKLLGRAIRSVLAQTYEDYEILVIDDCSTDDTEVVVKGFDSKKVHYIKLDNNTGGSMIPRRVGLKSSNSEFIAILDDDEFWFDNNKLKLQVEYLQKHQECVAVGTDWVTISENGERKDYKFPKSYEDVKKTILFRNCFYHSSIVYRRSAIEKIGGYCKIRKGVYKNYSDDYELWLKMGIIGEIVNLPIYGTGRDFAPNVKLGVYDSIYYMMKHLRFIRGYRKHYRNYNLAVAFRLFNALYSIVAFNGLIKRIVMRTK